jgi:uncharacterized protein YndB with AHSA1/START domain
MNTTTNKTQVEKNFREKSILVSREFNAPIEKVWKAYSQKELLDQWWGPSPWKAETKKMDFRNGGHWHYAMVGPENEKHWARMNYLNIDPLKKMQIEDLFCDENGKVNTTLPVSKGEMVFTKTTSGTKVDFKMYYATEEDVKKMVEMGFEQGITQCLEQLEELLRKI